MRLFATRIAPLFVLLHITLLVHLIICLYYSSSSVLSPFAKRLHHLVVLLSVTLLLVHQVIPGINQSCLWSYLWLPTLVTLSVLILVCLGIISHASDLC